MSGLFNSYEEDFNDTIFQLRESCRRMQSNIEAQKAHELNPSQVYHPPSSTGPLSRAQQLQIIQQSLSHAKDLLTSMTYEMTDVAAEERAAIKDKVESFRKTCSALDKEVALLRQSSNAADRADLLRFGSSASAAASGGRGTFMAEADAETQASRLLSLQTTEKLQGGTSTLRKAEAFLAQSNDLGRANLSVLRSQTEHIVHIHETTHDVDAEISQSQRILNQMHHTAIKNKLWLIGIIVLLVGCIFLLFYLH
ncbi:putative Qb-SNARE protein [Leptomonas seymouri]|uniref:Putative Qb-SNARE protein n=1 Tax=Leptomonas seymouri TaxID=5684 RepID=A0A0N1HXG1_LEPSE|nr:putative Qb-SNARE protein [Leptomonas seymouri]|eukprot:KPI87138.1 putative Qb-SNARE protein [Leptomonas seymouri]